jgi:hypothetical protein
VVVRVALIVLQSRAMLAPQIVERAEAASHVDATITTNDDVLIELLR